jgi:hypothetical protein
MTNTDTTAAALAAALWCATVEQCPPDGAVLATPGVNGHKVWPGEMASDPAAVWCHDCRADGFGFIPARMLTGSERISLRYDGDNTVHFDTDDDVASRVFGPGVTGRKCRAIVAHFNL